MTQKNIPLVPTDNSLTSMSTPTPFDWHPEQELILETQQTVLLINGSPSKKRFFNRPIKSLGSGIDSGHVNGNVIGSPSSKDLTAWARGLSSTSTTSLSLRFSSLVSEKTSGEKKTRNVRAWKTELKSTGLYPINYSKWALIEFCLRVLRESWNIEFGFEFELELQFELQFEFDFKLDCKSLFFHCRFHFDTQWVITAGYSLERRHVSLSHGIVLSQCNRWN